MKKKILSVLLAVVMLISVMPMSAMTASAATNWSGSVGYHDLDNNHTIAKGTSIKANSSSVKGYMYVYLDGTNVKTVNYNSTYTTDRCTKVSSWENKSNNMYLYLVTNCPSFTSRTCTQSQHCTTCGWVKNAAYGHDYSVYQSVKTLATCTTNRIDNYKCSRCSSTTTKTITNTALGHSYTKQGSLVSEATCTAKAVYKAQCVRCTATSGTMEVGSAKGHSFTKQGSKVSDATVDSPAIYNKQCERCTATSGTMQVGDKLPSMKVSYTDPLTNEEVDLGEATNDGVEDVVNKLMVTPFQIENQIFTGWFDDDDNAILKGTTRFDQMTNIKANFLGFDRMPKVIEDEKLVSDYLEFGLAGVQIRQDNTVELENGIANGEVYGGLRFVASLSDNVFNNLNLIEYGFVVATKANAAANAGVNENYVIKNGDKNVKRVNCMNQVDHRTFNGDYRLYTMVIDYAGNEAMKDVELVVRPYIAYTDANGVNRIFYGSYDGTVTYGGLSTSYNKAVTL